eukprot:7021262-Ditylum_brightwellii.AAC.1
MAHDMVNNTKAAHPNIQWANYSEVIQDQQEIGWVQILYGCFATTWITKQQTYEQKIAKFWAFRNKELMGEGGDHIRSYWLQKKVLLYCIKSLYYKQ